MRAQSCRRSSSRPASASLTTVNGSEESTSWPRDTAASTFNQVGATASQEKLATACCATESSEIGGVVQRLSHGGRHVAPAGIGTDEHAAWSDDVGDEPDVRRDDRHAAQRSLDE